MRGLRKLVSIRAPLQQRGEQKSDGFIIVKFKFQSAPHFSSEANVEREMRRKGPPSFNPRLTSAARRTHQPFHIEFNVMFQSAPHFSSEANNVLAPYPSMLTLFQSAPHFSSEANKAKESEPLSITEF